MRCQACGADLPDEAAFCIECGTPTERPGVTGATVVLPKTSDPNVITCAACGAYNPPYAVFCVRCGQRLGDPAAMPTRSSPPIIDLEPTRDLAAPPAPAQPWAQPATDAIAAVIFLVGLALLFFTRQFWPGILVVVGLTSFVSEALRGRYFNGLNSIIWLFGLALLFTIPRIFLPGILVLIALTVAVDWLRRRFETR
ncbi:zinc ribbon domain-containing protein [Candidatus Chloroploca asiatica]|uniref:DZANK-type domain-containing protein n=1 Tax=Candidatus Chloroploca asiatica TaxID=1506545 RepID=A0A2H3KTL2_9CHLR|nr:zinc ribbon domain-containing protein [Candidatus Chloroploca asiatica]PDV97202.1 hypothetical protein A9Q02_04655 [Candidatus Chloroploca asiatica]